MASSSLGVVGAASPGDRAGSVKELRVKGGLAYFGAGRFQDDRGFYEEIEFEASQASLAKQSGYSCSQRNVLRGIHCSPYGKIVVCQSGELWDVMVDLRPDSPTFMQWDAVLLSPERRTRVFVPPNVGHGFMALKDNTICLYMKLGTYDKAKEMEVNPFDPAIGIQWPRPVGGASDYLISGKDRNCPIAAEALLRRKEAEERAGRSRL